MENFLFFSALIGTFVTVFLVTRAVFASKDELQAAATLDSGQQRSEEKSILMRYARPIMNKYIVPAVEGMELTDYRSKIKRKLLTAGMAEEYSVDQFIALKLLLIMGFPFGYVFLNWMGEFGYPIWVVFPVSILGFFYPDLVMNGRIKNRQGEIRIMLPFVIDLLALSIEAGLEFFPALQKVSEKSKPGPLVDEINQILKELRIGASRSDALRGFAERADMIEVTSLVSVITTADQMGAGIGHVLKQQSEQIRLDRIVRAEKLAGRIPTKLQVVTVLILVPVILAIAMAPMILEAFDGGGF